MKFESGETRIFVWLNASDERIFLNFIIRNWCRIVRRNKAKICHSFGFDGGIGHGKIVARVDFDSYFVFFIFGDQPQIMSEQKSKTRRHACQNKFQKTLIMYFH